MSGSIRLFVTADLGAGAEIAASPPQAHFLGTVMRLGAGDHLRVFNGRDGEWQARITTLTRGRAVLTAEHPLRPQAPDGPERPLAFALLKRDATDLVARMATELGATALLPILTERTTAARVNLARLAAIAAEAAEQCERLTVPAILAPTPLAGLLDTWLADRPLFAAIERAEAPLPTQQAGPAGLLIGPEGGFTPAEQARLLATPLVHPISLGPLVLRAETACAAGLALLQPGRGR